MIFLYNFITEIQISKPFGSAETINNKFLLITNAWQKFQLEDIFLKVRSFVFIDNTNISRHSTLYFKTVSKLNITKLWIYEKKNYKKTDWETNIVQKGFLFFDIDITYWSQHIK